MASDRTTTCRVLCYEVAPWRQRRFRQIPCRFLHTHNKGLNYKLNREVSEFEPRTRDGTHALTITEPSMGPRFDQGRGKGRGMRIRPVGSGFGTSLSTSELIEERRRKMLQATLSRLRKREQEQEIEQSCGTEPVSRRRIKVGRLVTCP